MAKMAVTPIYGIKLENILLQTQFADDFETWYAASIKRVLSRFSKYDPVLTLTYFTPRSAQVNLAFVWEKVSFS